MLNKTQEEITARWKKLDTEHPLASIRCMAYNQEDYIGQTLDSFLAQETDFPFEVIIHDDASKDRTAEIIREYEKKFPLIVKPIYQTENLYSKRDGSLTRASTATLKGKYVALCEGDDYWIDPHKLQRQVDFLECHPEYTLSTENANVLFTNTGVVRPFSDEPEHDVSLDDLLIKRRFPTASAVYRLEDYWDYLRQDCPVFDSSLWAFMASKGKVHFNPVISSVYRRGSGVTESNKIRWARTSEGFNKAINGFYKPNKKVRKARNRILFTDFYNAYKAARKEHNKKEAVHFLRKMFFLSPSSTLKTKAKKILKNTKTSLFNFRYKNLPISYGIAKQELKTPVVVSLTSYPARFPTLHICLKSILNQTMKPSRVILWLDSDVSLDSIPKKILRLQKKGLEIRCGGESLKPHKKYFHAMKEFRDACIVTVDDDVIYTRDMLASLYASFQKHPDCISARRVHKIQYDMDHRAVDYNSWDYDCKKDPGPSMQLVATGVGGVLYPPHIFNMDSEYFDPKNIMDNAWSVDDIWLKFVENSLGIPVAWVSNKQTHPIYITDKSLAKTSLYISNVHNNHNDVAIKNCEQFFGKGL